MLIHTTTSTIICHLNNWKIHWHYVICVFSFSVNASNKVFDLLVNPQVSASVNCKPFSYLNRCSGQNIHWIPMRFRIHTLLNQINFIHPPSPKRKTYDSRYHFWDLAYFLKKTVLNINLTKTGTQRVISFNWWWYKIASFIRIGFDNSWTNGPNVLWSICQNSCLLEGANSITKLAEVWLGEAICFCFFA